MLIQSGFVQARHITAASPHTIRVDFKRPFKVKPHVNLGLVALDKEDSGALRINTNIEEIQKDYFVLRLNTWSDSELFWARVNWTAIGATNGKLTDQELAELEPEIQIIEHPPYDSDD